MASSAPMKRPSPDDRRAAILEAAGQVFFEQGYAATISGAIIERAGGSKRNIYGEFGSKEGLFIALVSESVEAAIAALPDDDFSGKKLDEILLEFGRRLLDVYTSPALIGVFRSIMSEALRFPELADRKSTLLNSSH